AGFENGVTEVFAHIATHNDAAGLGHKRSLGAHVAFNDDVAALKRNATARRGVAVDDEQSTMRGGCCRLGGVSFDVHDAGHHVFSNPGTRHAVDGDVAALVHPSAEVANIAFNLDIDGVFDPDGYRVTTAWVEHFIARSGRVVQLGVQLPQSLLGQINLNGRIT